ncbi:Threonylcarbamoyl-AMP synthase (EC [Olavius sp. associated proteobacterium Delta 1]|nr:Threonylcarbamoyl-AMP synthase (EC [Olavius sp. associated proteobacterium Delta 1]
MTRPRIIKVAPVNPAHEAIKTAASVIKAGGTIAYPTRCLYGLGTDAFSTGAVARVFAIKQRSAQKPLLILIDHPKRLERLVTRVPKIAANIMRQFWPGKVTLVFEAGEDLSPDLTGGSGKIGIRLPGHPVASALVEAVAGPITGTSANLSGSSGCHQISDLEPQVAHQLDLILDAGPLAGGRGSTVVDVTGGDRPIVLREGVISAREIMMLGS